MNIFRRNKVRSKLLALVRLQSAGAVLLAMLLYTAASTYLFTPKVIEAREEGEISFLSTDLKDPVRPSLEYAILHAKKSVLLIIYSLSDKKIISSLRTASEKGVEVVVIHDPIETTDAAFFVGKKVSCYPRRHQGLMHNKLLVIDHSVVWIGSANMSTRSLTAQGNLILTLRSPLIAEAIERLASTMISNSRYLSDPLSVQFSTSTLTIYFHPYHGKTALQSLINRIDKATKKVFVAMFTFTHPDLATALCRAKHRGVDVRVILDQESSKQTSRKTSLFLKKEGVVCGYRTKTGLLHYKVAIIDNLLVAGSCNWTKAGFMANHETMLFIDPLSDSQQQHIDLWWKRVEYFSSLHALHDVEPSG